MTSGTGQTSSRPPRTVPGVSPHFYGWNVVAATFAMALCSFGLGFYGIGMYVAALQRAHGWSASAVSAPVTVYYVAGALLTASLGGVYERFGPRAVVAAGGAAMAAALAALGAVSQPWHLYPVFLVMSIGWGAMSGAAINIILAPWSVRRRGLAVSLSFNGATLGGVIVAPALVPLIERRSACSAPCSAAAVALLGVIALAAAAMRRGPEALGLAPDGNPTAAPRARGRGARRARGTRRRAPHVAVLERVGRLRPRARRPRSVCSRTWSRS